MRLGELLLADGLIVPDELEAAVAEQRRSGTRIGSVLYLRGRVSADSIARALARLHGVPAALMRHLDSRDPTLTTRLPPMLARRWLALPVALSKGRGPEPGPALVVCMRDPSDPAAVAELRAAIAMPLIISVACEAVLATQVARAYPQAQGEDDDGIDVVFDDTSGPVSMPLADGDFAALTLVDLDDTRVARDHSQTSLMTPTRASGQMSVHRPSSPPSMGAALYGAPGAMSPPSSPLATGTLLPGAPMAAPPPPAPPPTVAAPAPEAPAPAAHRQTGPVSIPAAAMAALRTPTPGTRPTPPAFTAPLPPEPVLDFQAALAAIDVAPTRDAVGDAAIAFVRGAYASGMVLVVRDGIALGHRGFGGSLTPATVESILIPLNLPSVLRVAHEGGRPFVGAPPEGGGTVQDRFLRLLGSPREVIVAPVVLRDRPVCLVFAAQPLRDGDEAQSDLLAVVAAMEEAYLRIIREGKKTSPGTTPLA